MANLIEIYKTLFPDNGSDAWPVDAPMLPMDLFAYTAHILERSGAYHHVYPKLRGAPVGTARGIAVDDKMRIRVLEEATRWRRNRAVHSGLPLPPHRVAHLWIALGGSSAESVLLSLSDSDKAPSWWAIALELMMIADETCTGIGFNEKNRFYSFAVDPYVSEDLSSGRSFRRIQSAPFSLSTASDDILCVQPKSRTPGQGCTLRSLSHHLALLPPKGQVRARWVRPPFEEQSGQDRGLGLLLIPFPYRVLDNSFQKLGASASTWGWFDAKQTWLPTTKDSGQRKRQQLRDFVVSLIANAKRAKQRVDAIVLPELALDYQQFRWLARRVARDTKIDFLISGVSSDRSARNGNFVAIAPFFLMGTARTAKSSGWDNLILVREKHHRWQLEESQIRSYNLRNLDPNKKWWESLQILKRSLDVLVYRGETTLTTLICEDLARVDPCQAVVRAIGPNLLIAILMDGPQIASRWPARYAAVLAEDPGTSVLSFTSLGLIARQNDLGHHPQNCSIALWKDEVKGVVTLELPREKDAVILQLRSTRKEERTLDGRSDGEMSLRWEYHSQYAVAATHTPKWIRSGRGRS